MINVETSGRVFALVVAVVVALTGCASPPNPARQATAPDGQTSTARSTAPKTLRMASIREPVDGVVIFAGAGSILAQFGWIYHAGLTIYDEQGNLQPRLAQR